MTQRSTEPLFGDGGFGQYRLSLEAFYEYAQHYHTHITKSYQTLYPAVVPFSSYDRSILPVQSKKLLHALKELQKLIEEFSWLLHDTERLPVILVALRYRLLAVVNTLEEQISRLLDLLHTYHVACISPSEEEKWLRKEIYSSFERFRQFTIALTEQLELLHDEAVEQERQLLSLYENY